MNCPNEMILMSVLENFISERMFVQIPVLVCKVRLSYIQTFLLSGIQRFKGSVTRLELFGYGVSASPRTHARTVFFGVTI